MIEEISVQIMMVSFAVLCVLMVIGALVLLVQFVYDTVNE